jgi:DNA-binding NarL/FixJ family response regulator
MNGRRQPSGTHGQTGPSHHPGSAKPIRVLAADDQRVVREGLVLLLGLLPGVEVVGTAADGEEAVTMATALQPDVVLMDLRMPRCDGVEATRRLRGQAPQVIVIALTTYADDRSVIDALQAGARGYLTKDAGAAEISRALQQVVSGQAVIDPAVQQHVVQAITAGPPAQAPRLPDGLTPREAEILALIADGLSNTEIAEHLVVSEATVKSHINHLLSKIGARDRAQAVIYAYRRGIAPGLAKPPPPSSSDV